MKNFLRLLCRNFIYIAISPVIFSIYLFIGFVSAATCFINFAFPLTEREKAGYEDHL